MTGYSTGMVHFKLLMKMKDKIILPTVSLGCCCFSVEVVCGKMNTSGNKKP